MVLQALLKHYENLHEQGKVPAFGWMLGQVGYAIVLNEDGAIIGIESLFHGNGNKTVKADLNIPARKSRTTDQTPFFMCDKPEYLLGISEKDPEKAKYLFRKSREFHLSALEDVDSAAARAVKAFFTTWNPESAREDPIVDKNWKELVSGADLVFRYEEEYAHEDKNIQKKWEKMLELDSEGEPGICLVTGKQTSIARTLPVIKGIPGGQASGVMFSSINKPAFEYFGKKQGLTSPIGDYAAFACISAENYLLNQQRMYADTVGPVTILFWADGGSEDYQKAFSCAFEPDKEHEDFLETLFGTVGNGIPLHSAFYNKTMECEEELSLQPLEKCYIYGVGANMSRHIVRFFHEDTFGNIIRHLKEHYDNLNIILPSDKVCRYPGFKKIMMETVNPNDRTKEPYPVLTHAMLQAIFTGSPYPEMMLTCLVNRIHADRDKKFLYPLVALLKAYEVKNKCKEDISTMALNEERNDAAYVMGRLFSVLEEIQAKSLLPEHTPINATIKDRYFNSAGRIPDKVFPILLNLKNAHIKKMARTRPGLAVSLDNQVLDLVGRLDAFPKRLDSQQHCTFLLGYYHQTQKRYQKRESAESQAAEKTDNR